jgi:toxin FitB
VSGSLLDTNILSEFARRDEAHPAVKHWLSTVDDLTLFVSVLALAEIRRGIEALDPGKRRRLLEQWFEHELIPSFDNRILPVSQAIADRWAILSVTLERKGKTQPLFDGLMAVTALEHDLTVVTRNVKDFVNFDVRIFNPWD